mgnify:CR=1 FL=1
MKKIIKSKIYNFEITAENNYFGIKAKHKPTGRFSYINNLNAILAELNVNINDNKYQDSSWSLSKNEVENLGKLSKELLLNNSFRKYIEEKLDEDRECGEWENIER